MMSLITRIRKVIDESELSSAAFADKIGVQRSSISHILSGRNKPSLDFVLKILHAFPSVHSDWLLLGNDTVHSIHGDPDIDLFSEKKPTNAFNTTSETEPTSTTATPPPATFDTNSTPPAREVKQITVFYSDGTCNTYTNKK